MRVIKKKTYSEDPNLDEDLTSLFSAVGGRLRRVGNIEGERISFTSSATVDAENTISHHLGRTPIGYDVEKRDKAGVVYNGTTAWTKDKIYLKVNVASVQITIFIY